MPSRSIWKKKFISYSKRKHKYIKKIRTYITWIEKIRAHIIWKRKERLTFGQGFAISLGAQKRHEQTEQREPWHCSQ